MPSIIKTTLPKKKRQEHSCKMSTKYDASQWLIIILRICLSVGAYVSHAFYQIRYGKMLRLMLKTDITNAGTTCLGSTDTDYAHNGWVTKAQWEQSMCNRLGPLELGLRRGFIVMWHFATTNMSEFHFPWETTLLWLRPLQVQPWIHSWYREAWSGWQACHGLHGTEEVGFS